MNSEVDRLFHQAVQLLPQERAGFLADECPSTTLRAEVQSLLHHVSDAESLFDKVIQEEAATLKDADVLTPGDQIGSYRIVSLLGSGGMGRVYLAQRADGSFDQLVAIKIVRASSIPSLVDRFHQERLILGRLNHPNIARILDGGQTGDGRQYFVMEYVPGQRIDDFCDHNNLTLHQRLELFLKVCDAVRHAHQHLIIHRDLKPANIFVTDESEPKLLDFGIAKIMDPAHRDHTSTQLLTPAYASPEQIRGGMITTATDVYLLGSVLFTLLTGKSFHDRDNEESGSNRKYSKLPRDIDYILRKALRDEPNERYSSVDALANDLRAFLEWQPVKARSGDVWYRTRKFLRRYRVVVAATTVTVSSLVFSLYTANHERRIAQQRFLQVRQLSNKVLALDQVVGGLHSSTRARNEIVELSKNFLESLSADASDNQDLALEIGEAYSLLARAQGISVASNLGQLTEAEESLRKADAFIEPYLRANPNSRKAILASAKIGHDRTILAETNQRDQESQEQAQRSSDHLEKLLSLGPLSAAESETIGKLFYDLALACKNIHRLDDAVRHANHSIEVSGKLTNTQFRLSLAKSLLADLLRLTGHPEEALRSIRESRSNLENAQFPAEVDRRSAWFTVLWREGKILGATSGLGLNRFDEATVVLQQAFNLVEEWSQNDREDAWSRLFFASVGRELGDLLTRTDPQKALAIYDHALLRLREIKNNSEARRGEAEILARSAYALRRLNRIDAAKSRIDSALLLLSPNPADSVTPYTPVDVVLRALGDHYAETAQPQQAAAVYEDLLIKIMAAKPNAHNELHHALSLSQIYGSLAVLNRRNSQTDRAKEFLSLRQELKRHWDRKLPGNSIINRQLS